jgi:hypothetical protein
MEKHRFNYIRAVRYKPTTTRFQKIRRLAYYMYLDLPKQEQKVYYDCPDYPAWRGGFIESGLKDFRGRTYGVVLDRPPYAGAVALECLTQARKAYRHFSSIPWEQLT